MELNDNMDNMPFERKWDDTCPRTWDRFEQGGRTYIIQDIPPEDDEQAIQILVDHLSTDEVLCKLSDLINDQESVNSMKAFWTECLSQRMSLGCYTDVQGKKTLVALNVCVIASIEEKFPTMPINGVACQNVYGAMALFEAKCDPFQYLNENALMQAFGLVVTREFRGAKLGAKLLLARQPLSLAYGVKATVTVFTGPASQTLATRCGFTTIHEFTLKEIAEAGFNYPKNDHVVKLMFKKFTEA